MRRPGSIRRRLVVGLIVAAAVLSGVLYASVRGVSAQAVQETQDRILGAATLAIAEELRGGEGGIRVAIPYAAFSMLGAVGEDRVFYRIVSGGETVTGYEGLPMPPGALAGMEPQYFDAVVQGASVRVGAVERAVLVDGTQAAVQVLVAQTRSAQETISRRMANRAAALGVGLFVLAALLSVWAAGRVLQPVNRLAEAVGRRGPQDLRPVERRVPEELVPLRAALNGFIARLRGALSRTETFITEAAHHVRTPLATVRAEAEIALRRTEDEAVRGPLRNMIRAADNSARSASQLLDHAAVVYRTDQRADEVLDLAAVLGDVADGFRPTADMRDIGIEVSVPEGEVPYRADRLLLESALRNLIDNALKYSFSDGVVSVGLRVEREIVIEVCDRGRGLGAGDPVRLAARFQRGENAGDVVGSGLGLTIVQDAARAMGGRLDLTEREGGGACARLNLPLG